MQVLREQVPLLKSKQKLEGAWWMGAGLGFEMMNLSQNSPYIWSKGTWGGSPGLSGVFIVSDPTPASVGEGCVSNSVQVLEELGCLVGV